jgi:site-specific recombinase XerD
MSTYIDVAHPERHRPYLDIPDDVVDYLHYLDFVKQRSPRTINGYYLDLRGFFRYMAVQWGLAMESDLPEHIKLAEITTKQIASITKRDLYNYLDFVGGEAHNGPKARARKLAAIRGFFRYMVVQESKLTVSPAQDISLGTPRKALPKYLTLEESLKLLKNIQSDFYERDFCIITLFLNCGMRLAELVLINLGDFRGDTIRIIGKGGKERLVYLNTASKEALQHYLPVRSAMPNLVDHNALFVSKRTGRRLTARRVEQIVSRCLQTAGLSGYGYSPHKLRHTAATLMYQYGNVDMLALKEILGHANVSTTQIYTHINQRQLQEAVASSPLSNVPYQKQEMESGSAVSEQDAGKKTADAGAAHAQKNSSKK